MDKKEGASILTMNSTNGMSSPLATIMISAALILLVSQAATSSLAAIPLIGNDPLASSACAQIHNAIQALYLSGSPSVVSILIKPAASPINCSGNAITCRGVDFSSFSDAAGIIISSGDGFLEYDPLKIRFEDCTVVFGSTSLIITLAFHGDGASTLEVQAL